MKKISLSLLSITLFFTACSENKEQSKKINEPIDNKEITAADQNQSQTALVTIETATYQLNIYKVIPFHPEHTVALVPKKGNQYVVLDISVKNKTDRPINMGVILSVANIQDKTGTKFGDVLGSLSAYNLDNPDNNAKKEYDKIWSETLPAGEFHRSVAIGFQAPISVKDFEISLPESDDLNLLDKKIKGKFSL